MYLDRLVKDAGTFANAFFQVKEEWTPVENRGFAMVDWAPRISAFEDNRPHTRDLAVLDVQREKLRYFRDNIVDLGAFRSLFLP